MRLTLEILFWICLAIVFYTYIGYGLLIWVVNIIKGIIQKKILPPAGEFTPAVALVIAAYNEEDYIEDKIKNTLELDYPEGKLHVYFITDGSADATPDIVAKYPRMTLFHQPERRG